MKLRTTANRTEIAFSVNRLLFFRHCCKRFGKKLSARVKFSQNGLLLNQIKSSLHWPYYAEACNELRGPSPRLSAWATQLRRNVATMASRWRHCADLTGPGIDLQTSRTDSARSATELTAGLLLKSIQKIISHYFTFSIFEKFLNIVFLWPIAGLLLASTSRINDMGRTRGDGAEVKLYYQ